MMFFTYETDLPPNVGFSLYSFPHLSVLAIIAAVCVFSARWFRAQSAARQHHVTQRLGWANLLFEFLRTAVYIKMGGMSIYELPLHLCGMAVFLCFIHSMWKWDWAGQVLYTLCLPGACAALLFPDWTMYPFFSFAALHGFAAHGLIVLYIVLQVSAGRIVPRLRAVWKPVLFLCITAPPVAWFNLQFHTNYMFLQLPSPDSPLVAVATLAGGSHTGYLLLFAAGLFAVMCLMDLPFSLKRWHQKK